MGDVCWIYGLIALDGITSSPAHRPRVTAAMWILIPGTARSVYEDIKAWRIRFPSEVDGRLSLEL